MQRARAHTDAQQRAPHTILYTRRTHALDAHAFTMTAHARDDDRHRTTRPYAVTERERLNAGPCLSLSALLPAATVATAGRSSVVVRSFAGRPAAPVTRVPRRLRHSPTRHSRLLRPDREHCTPLQLNSVFFLRIQTLQLPLAALPARRRGRSENHGNIYNHTTTMRQSPV